MIEKSLIFRPFSMGRCWRIWCICGVVDNHTHAYDSIIWHSLFVRTTIVGVDAVHQFSLQLATIHFSSMLVSLRHFVDQTFFSCLPDQHLACLPSTFCRKVSAFRIDQSPHSWPVSSFPFQLSSKCSPSRPLFAREDPPLITAISLDFFEINSFRSRLPFLISRQLFRFCQPALTFAQLFACHPFELSTRDYYSPTEFVIVICIQRWAYLFIS